MRKTKIVADTSCDLLSLKHVAFACAPMKIIIVMMLCNLFADKDKKD